MKTIAISILAVVLSFNMSCQKEQDVSKTINVSLAPGETYSTKLDSKWKEDFSITLQAEHAALSELSSGSHCGDKTFTYTASSQYIGSDEVQITAKNSHGGCPMHNDASTTYVYKITVSGETH